MNKPTDSRFNRSIFTIPLSVFLPALTYYMAMADTILPTGLSGPPSRPCSFPLTRTEWLESTNSHSVLVSAGPACAKHWPMWGLFTVICYSHQTRLVKSQHVALLLKHPGEPEHQADRACVSSSVSSFSSPLPGNPHSTPTFPFFLCPLRSHTVSESLKLSTHSVILLSTKSRLVWCLARRHFLSSPLSGCQASQPVCTLTDHT